LKKGSQMAALFALVAKNRHANCHVRIVLTSLSTGSQSISHSVTWPPRALAILIGGINRSTPGRTINPRRLTISR
jgi:hypothetical protein